MFENDEKKRSYEHGNFLETNGHCTVALKQGCQPTPRSPYSSHINHRASASANHQRRGRNSEDNDSDVSGNSWQQQQQQQPQPGRPPHQSHHRPSQQHQQRRLRTDSGSETESRASRRSHHSSRSRRKRYAALPSANEGGGGGSCARVKQRHVVTLNEVQDHIHIRVFDTRARFTSWCCRALQSTRITHGGREEALASEHDGWRSI